MSPSDHHRPPPLAQWLLARFLSAEEQMDVLGDLEEEYAWRVREGGVPRAALAYWAEVVLSLPAFLSRSVIWTVIMWKNYLKTALRHFRRHKAYSSINVLGLSIGLACSFLIVLWVQDEVGYDRFHEEGDQLYRVMRNYFTDDQIYTWSALPKPLAQVLEDDYPEITHAVLVTTEKEMLLAHQDQTFRERGRYASPALFEIFSFPFIQGDPGTALDDPYAIAISESLARKYFGADWQAEGRTLGQTLRIDNRQDFTVTGVFEDVPAHSSIRFDYVIPVEEYIQRNTWLEHWGNSGLLLFVRLRQDADPAAVSEKIKNVIKDHHASADVALFLQPYADIYLYSDFEDGQLVGGRIEYVRMFGLVALFILLIASINFMNLSTARSARRTREVGVRKAVGATQRTLIGQFIGESVLTALFALVLAMLLVAVALPAFNELTSKHIAIDYLNPTSWLTFLGIAVLTGLLAGSYPAFYLSSFNVVSVLRGAVARRPGSVGLRKGLVVFQFTMSMLLIIGTLTVYTQIDYIHSKNLGMDRENLVYLDLEGGIAEQYDAFKQELLARPGIATVTTSSQNPLSVDQSTSDPTWDGKDSDSEILFHIINANYDFFKTMKMEMADGRVFSKAFATDSVNYIINEESAHAMGMDNVLGARLSFWGQEGEIVGVVKDFHIDSFYEPIEPTIIRFDPESTRMLFVRTQAGKTPEALVSLEALYKTFNPEYPFDYRFLDEDFEQMYRSETVIGKLANAFAILAVFIACLGLFGLAAFTAEQRAKEIGIRKVLGASVPNLVVLLSRDFIKLVMVAFLLSIPVAYYAMQEWLSNFAYHIDLSIGIFAIAGVAALMIAWLTVSYQSIRAALANPATSLKTE